MSRPTALERAQLRVTGQHGELAIQDGQLTIEKHGASPSTITVGIDTIRSTAIVAPRAGGRGWLHVTVVGGTPTPPGELVAMTDPYTIRVPARSAGAAKRFVRLVHDHLRQRGLPPEPELGTAEPTDGRYSSAVAVTAEPVTGPNGRRRDTPPDGVGRSPGPSSHRSDRRGGQRSDVSDERTRQLAQLDELRAAGTLTEAEFDRLRSRVLG